MLAQIWTGSRWGMRTVLVLAGIAIVIAVVSLLMNALDSTAAVVGIAVGAAVVNAVVLGVIVYKAVPRGVLTSREVWLAVIWGALVATFVAGELNSFGPGEFVAPFVEELLKAGGVLVVLRCLRGPVTPVRGFGIGLVVGAAFEVYENVLYILLPDTTPEPGAEATEALRTAGLRLVLGFGLHAVTTALVGAAVGYAICRTGRAVSRAGLAALAGAIAIHLVWDVAGDLGGAEVPLMVVDYLVIIAVFFLTRRWSIAASRVWAGAQESGIVVRGRPGEAEGSE